MGRRANTGELLRQKFESRIKKDSKSGCWLWTGATNGWGYGYIQSCRKLIGAHRVSYTLFKGEIPEGKQLDHLCRIRNCVNPDHLEAVTVKENLLRGESWSGANHRKTHCKNGHEFSGYNLKVVPNGRACRTCINARARKYTAQRRKVA